MCMHISADHIINSHGIVVVQLTCLFNCMIRQAYVPDAFGTGIIIPLVKDITGNRGSADNYRGITLSSDRRGPGSVGRRCMIGTLNLGLHTHLELPGPSPELVTIF